MDYRHKHDTEGVTIRRRSRVNFPSRLTAVAGCGHSTKPQIGRVGQYRSEQRIHIVVVLTRAQVGERGGEARCPVHLVQQFRDAHTRHHRLDAIGKGAGFGSGCRLGGQHTQTSVPEFHTFEPIPL
jgi:hypothetical protein